MKEKKIMLILTIHKQTCGPILHVKEHINLLSVLQMQL